MNPTCGPLPWVSTTRQPSLTSAATCLRGLAGVLELLGDGAALALQNQGVAADGDHRRPGEVTSPPDPSPAREGEPVPAPPLRAERGLAG